MRSKGDAGRFLAVAITALALGVATLVQGSAPAFAMVGPEAKGTPPTRPAQPAPSPAAVPPLPPLPKDCRSAPEWLRSAPRATTSPAPGVVLRSWRGPARWGAPLQVVIADADPARIRWRATTTPRLGDAAWTTDLTAGAHAAMGLNGDYFTWGPTGQIPFGVQVTDGTVRFAPSGSTRGIGVRIDGRMRHAYLSVSGGVEIVNGDADPRQVAVDSVNAPSARVALVSEYGARQPVAGSWYVSVRAGVVLSSGPARPHLPTGDDVLLVAGPSAAQSLSWVRPGSTAHVDVGVQGPDGVRYLDALGSGSAILRDRAVTSSCKGRNAISTRPRSIVAWNAQGSRIWLMTVQSIGQGPNHPGNLGLTYAEVADTLRHLGATDAVPFDGGGSTTLAVRDGDRTTRVDAPATAPMRPVPDAAVLTTYGAGWWQTGRP